MTDLRYAIRLLLKRPLMSTAIVITIGLGIAATTSVFSVVDGVLLEPLEYERPDELVTVWEHNYPRERENNVVSPANYLAWRDEGVFEDLAAVVAASGTITGSGDPERVGVITASAAFFEALGVNAVAGRVYAEAEDVDGAEDVAVLGHGFWQRRFGGDSGIIGRTITLNDRSITVLGVLPADFSFTFGSAISYPGTADVWLPHQFGDSERNFSGRYLQVIGRLPAGVTLDAAQSRMTALAQRLEAEFPDRQAGWGVNVMSLEEQVVGNASGLLLVIFGAVGFVLLIAVANVANLLVARTTERHQEVAIRAALGAGRARIVGQMFVESLVLAMAGGVLGITLTVWTVGLIHTIGPDIPRLENVAVDPSVLGFAAGATIFAGILFGLAPAIQVVRSNLAAWLKARGAEGSRRDVRRLRSGLIIAEIALSLVLLIGAGLMIRSLIGMLNIGVGLDTANVLTAQVQLPGSRYEDRTARSQFYNTLIDRVAESPGVEAASAITWLPLGGPGTGTTFWVADRPLPAAGEYPVAAIRWVHHDYHRTMGIDVVEGRTFDETDVAGAPLRVVINQSMANEFWPDESAIGKTISMEWEAVLDAEVIGVVHDVRAAGPSVTPGSMIYWNLDQHQGFNFATVVVRTAGDPLAFLPTLRATVRDQDPLLPIYAVRTMDGLLDQALVRPRFTAAVLGIFAFVALILACVGIYGVMAYVTGQRAQEFGIRMAMGAGGDEVVRLVLRQGMRLVVVALIIGLIASWAVSRLLESMVFDVAPTDPLTFALMSVILGGTAMLACWLPARRAASVDPVDAMRKE
jgi:putative ABC transport system permease protein